MSIYHLKLDVMWQICILSGLNLHNGFTWILITGYEYKSRLQCENLKRTGF